MHGRKSCECLSAGRGSTARVAGKQRRSRINSVGHAKKKISKKPEINVLIDV